MTEGIRNFTSWLAKASW